MSKGGIIPPPSQAAISICGLDVGSENGYIAVARAGGIEILLNEYSQRSTPAYIGFGDKQRELGVSAKQKQMMNLSNTCFAPIRYIGRQFKELNEDLPFKAHASSTGEIAFKVWHNGEELDITATQLLAMYFTKLRQVASNSVDCVINCPSYFTDSQRRSLMDAASIAGLNPIRLIPDMTAIGLYYGFYRTAPNQNDITIVAFVDCGHSSTQCAIILFNNKENYLKVLSVEYESELGGRNFDEVLANYFIEQNHLQLGKRGKLRILAECEKLKKQMSANSNELPINVECLQDDKDFSGKLDRATFEELSQGLFKRIEALFVRALNNASDKFAEENKDGKLGEFRIDSAEICGGTSRVAAIKRLVKSVFGHEASTTLNADEAVARGCALQCAMLSPTFKVARQLAIHDYNPFQIDFRYWNVTESGNESDFKTIPKLFQRGQTVPCTRMVTLVCNTLPIMVSFDYHNDHGLIVPIGEFKINSLTPIQLNRNTLKIRVRLDPNGIVHVYSANLIIEEKTSQNSVIDHVNLADEEDMANENNHKQDSQEQPMETEADSSPNDQGNEKEKNKKNKPKEKGDEEEKKAKKPKPTSVSLNVETVWLRGKLSQTDLERMREFELNLISNDKNWKEKMDAKNTLEEYVYEWRDKLEQGSFDPFIPPSDKQAFMSQLNEVENWLYAQEDAGEMHSKSIYDEKLNYLKDKYSQGILYREKEFKNSPVLMEQLGQRLQQGKKVVQGADMSVEAEQIKKLDAEIDEKQKWLDSSYGIMQNALTTDNPPITCDQIRTHFDVIDNMMSSIFRERQRRIDEKKRKAEEAKQKKEQEEKQDATQSVPTHPTEPPMDVPMDADVAPTI